MVNWGGFNLERLRTYFEYSIAGDLISVYCLFSKLTFSFVYIVLFHFTEPDKLTSVYQINNLWGIKCILSYWFNFLFAVLELHISRFLRFVAMICVGMIQVVALPSMIESKTRYPKVSHSF